MDISQMSIAQIKEAFVNGTLSSKQLVQKSIDIFNQDKTSDIPLNAFLEMYDDAVKLAEESDALIAAALELDGGKAGDAVKKLFLQLQDLNLYPPTQHFHYKFLHFLM